MATVTAGTIVGEKYRLEAPIGQGGMASVWRATHLTLESSVAIKFLDNYGHRRAKQVERFLREAKLAANIEHRNVVRILDFGLLPEDEQPFMVLELLHGRSLAEALEGDDPLDELELLQLTAQLLGGIAAVHDAGIVHRDVKPDNVFLVRDADGAYPKILDFGISRSDAAGRVTDTGAVVGTPLYMSPEQARGVKDLDHRSDLWSVGMILYEALTGAAPFEEELLGDVLVRVATEDVPPLDEVRPDLPPAVVEVVMKALRRDREARWPDARAMRSKLIAAADALERQAQGPSGARRASRGRSGRGGGGHGPRHPRHRTGEAPEPGASALRANRSRAVLVGVAAAVIGSGLLALGLVAWSEGTSDGSGPTEPLAPRAGPSQAAAGGDVREAAGPQNAGSPSGAAASAQGPQAADPPALGAGANDDEASASPAGDRVSASSGAHEPAEAVAGPGRTQAPRRRGARRAARRAPSSPRSATEQTATQPSAADVDRRGARAVAAPERARDRAATPSSRRADRPSAGSAAEGQRGPSGARGFLRELDY